MLDAGTATFRLSPRLATDELDVFLTHAHLDHISGLTYLFSVLHERPLRRVTVHAAAERLEAIDRHLFSIPLFPQKPPMEFRPLAEEVALPEGGRLTHFPVKHPGGCTAFRLDWPGHALAYVTDTTAHAQADYADKIRGVDLLLHECYFPDGEEQRAELYGHSCTSEVARLAQRAGVGRLVLVHINPLATGDDPIGIDRARRVFPHTELGRDLLELDF
jgi:ribonuclease BN (tRNA processing enzyme)